MKPIDSDRWAGSLHWPLAPFGLVVNDLALSFPSGTRSVAPPFSPKYDATRLPSLDSYRKHFLLLGDDLIRDSEGHIPQKPDPEPKKAVSKGNTLDSAFHNLQTGFFPEPPPASDVVRYCMLYPQAKEMSGLVISDLWQADSLKIKRGIYVKNLDSQPLGLKSEEFDHAHFITFSEAFLPLAETRAPHVRAFSALRASKDLEDYLADPEHDIGRVHMLPILCSFFADGIVDAGLIVPVTASNGDTANANRGSQASHPSGLGLSLKNAEPLEGKTNPEELVVGAVHSLLMQFHLRRLDWLAQWIARLPDAAAQTYMLARRDNAKTYGNLGSRDAEHERATQETRELVAHAIIDIAAVLAWIEDGETRDRWARSLAAIILKPENARYDRLDVIEYDLDRDPRKLAEGRKNTIREFLRDALEVACRCRFDKPSVHLRGVLANRVVDTLHRRAERLPAWAVITLTGAPGGGKSLASREFHAAAMRHVVGVRGQLDLEYVTELRAGSRSESTLKWRDSAEPSKQLERVAFQRWWWGVFKALEALFTLPGVTDIRSPVDLHVFFRRQVQGTHWWTWEKPEVAIRDDYFWTRDGADIALSGDYYGAIRRLCLGPLGGSPRLLLQGGEQLEQAAKALLVGYVLRLVRKLRAEMGEEQRFQFNWRSINCRALGADGEDYQAALRSLFGFAEHGLVRTASGMDELMTRTTPGLFQTCALMGGTLCLEEITKCPVNVQDNLLGPLDSRRVHRVGAESFGEPINELRLVASTTQGFDGAVRLFEETHDGSAPRGLRPDLRDRLVTVPPVELKHVLDYFVYEDTEHQEIYRRLYRAEFASLMSELDRSEGETDGSDAVVGEGLLDAWQDIYDFVDDAVLTEAAGHGRTDGSTLAERKRMVARRLSMRFLSILARMLRQAGNTDELMEIKADLLSSYLPESLDYFLHP